MGPLESHGNSSASHGKRQARLAVSDERRKKSRPASPAPHFGAKAGGGERQFHSDQNHPGVSKNRGTPKSSILIGFSIINHPFWGTPIFGNTQIEIKIGHYNDPYEPISTMECHKGFEWSLISQCMYQYV